MKRKISNKLFNELCHAIIDFENAPDNANENYSSDSEWLYIFYGLCCRICDEIREGRRED